MRWNCTRTSSSRSCSISCVDNGIEPIGYCPIGSPGRPERDRTPDDTVDTEDPVIVGIAQRLGVHPAVVCVKWAVQRGTDADSLFDQAARTMWRTCRRAVTDPLSDGDMRAIAGIDRNCRLIKGQVFLWKEDQSWEDLWDLDGEIKA